MDEIKNTVFLARGRELDALRRGLNDLTAYLISDKFNEDPTVQVRDVLARINKIQFDAIDAYYQDSN